MQGINDMCLNIYVVMGNKLFLMASNNYVRLTITIHRHIYNYNDLQFYLIIIIHIYSNILKKVHDTFLSLINYYNLSIKFDLNKLNL